MPKTTLVFLFSSAFFLSTPVIAEKPEREMPAQSNKQSMHGSTQGLERAAERRSEQGAAHAKSGVQHPADYDGTDYDNPETLTDLIDDEADRIKRQVGLVDDYDGDAHDDKARQKKAGKQTRQPDDERGFFQRMWPFGNAE